MIEFRETESGRRVRAAIAPALERGEAAKIRANLGTVAENVYNRLPSGDYGRGDVRREIERILDRDLSESAKSSLHPIHERRARNSTESA